MTDKKTDQEARIKNLEFAIAMCVENYDEIYGLLICFREYLECERYNKHNAKDALNGIFSLLIKNQMDLADHAGMEI